VNLGTFFYSLMPSPIKPKITGRATAPTMKQPKLTEMDRVWLRRMENNKLHSDNKYFLCDNKSQYYLCAFTVDGLEHLEFIAANITTWNGKESCAYALIVYDDVKKKWRKATDISKDIKEKIYAHVLPQGQQALYPVKDKSLLNTLRGGLFGLWR